MTWEGNGRRKRNNARFTQTRTPGGVDMNVVLTNSALVNVWKTTSWSRTKRASCSRVSRCRATQDNEFEKAAFNCKDAG
eukprot:3028928-Pleurochrysis_carterae.AAC.1